MNGGKTIVFLLGLGLFEKVRDMLGPRECTYPEMWGGFYKVHPSLMKGDPFTLWDQLTNGWLENGVLLNDWMSFLLNMGMFHTAMLVCRRVYKLIFFRFLDESFSRVCWVLTNSQNFFVKIAEVFGDTYRGPRKLDEWIPKMMGFGKGNSC